MARFRLAFEDDSKDDLDTDKEIKEDDKKDKEEKDDKDDSKDDEKESADKDEKKDDESDDEEEDKDKKDKDSEDDPKDDEEDSEEESVDDEVDDSEDKDTKDEDTKTEKEPKEDKESKDDSEDSDSSSDDSSDSDSDSGDDIKSDDPNNLGNDTMDDSEGDFSVSDSSDDSGDSSSDSGDSDSTDDTESDPTETPETPEEPVELPKIGDLEVEKVYEEQKEKEEEMKKADETAKGVVAISESLNNLINKRSYIGKSEVSDLLTSLDNYKEQVGVRFERNTLSLESYSDRLKACKIANEGLIDFLKSIWDYIFNAIAKAIKWVKNFFYNLFFGVDKDIKSVKKYTNLVLGQRDDKSPFSKRLESAKKLANARTSIDKERYISTETSSKGYDLSRLLNLQTKRVDNYVFEFENLLYILNPSRCKSGAAAFLDCYGSNPFNKVFNKDFIKVIDNIINDEIYKDIPTEIKLFFSPKCFIPPRNTSDFVHWLSKEHLVNYNGKPPGEDQEFFRFEDVLGGFYILMDTDNISSRPMKGQDVPFQSNADTFQRWTKFNLIGVRYQTDGFNKGFIRYVDSDEIEKTSNMVIQVLNEVEAFNKGTDDFLEFLESLNKIIDKARTTPSFDTTTDRGVYKLQLLNYLSSALTNIVKILTNVMDFYYAQIRTVCNAWYLYLEKVYDLENKMSKE